MTRALRPGGTDDLTYVTGLVDGRLSTVWPDGTVLPLVRGGADDDGKSDGKSDGDGDVDGDGKGDGDGDGDGDGKQSGDTLTLTKAELNDRLAKERNRGKKTAEDAAKTAADRAKMDDAEKAKAELADAQKAADDKVKGSHARLVKAEAKVAALAAGVDAKRMARFLRNVDLDDIDVDDDGDVDEAAVAKAVKAALDDVPEFKAGSSNGNGAGKGGASGGEFNGGGDKKVWTRAEVAKLSVEEFEKHEAAIMAQMKAGGLT